MITVVNKKRHEPADIDIYVGRGSPLGNPLPIGPEIDRATAIAYYHKWLPNKLREKDRKVCDEMNRIYRAAKAGNVNLVCFCKPEDCHADLIKKLVEEKL